MYFLHCNNFKNKLLTITKSKQFYDSRKEIREDSAQPKTIYGLLAQIETIGPRKLCATIFQEEDKMAFEARHGTCPSNFSEMVWSLDILSIFEQFCNKVSELEQA